MWAQYLGPIFAGLASLVTAIGGIVLAHSRSVSADLASCKWDSARREADQRQWRVVALRYMAQLERQLLQTTMSVPERPDDLLL